jgi:NAD(P)-dependent dehydrogenase (short-subunit alcohol dehydrogenase family)
MFYDGIAGKRVLVTAGASGICAVVAERFVGHGACVHVGDIAGQSLNAFRERHPDIPATAADVAVSADVDRLFAAAADTLGGLDILVSGAGIAGPVGTVEQLDEEGWRRTIDVNLTGSFLLARRAVPLLKAQGSGSIVLMGSNYSLWAQAARSPYVASKWGLLGLMKTLAMELGPHGIRVNAICPGNVEGERIERVIAMEAEAKGITREQLRELWERSVSLRTFVTPENIADQILFVCSDAGARISGQALSVDGNTESV